VFDESARALSDLVVTIDAASVFTNHKERDGHVRSRDFLAAEANPEIRFVMTRAVAETETTGRIEGDLTIRGVTRPATLEVTLNKIGPYPFGSNYVLGVSGRGVIKRSDYGMTYALDNGWVGDEVEITIEAEAIRQ
jgi:polyisoprenoid-binding protein YceI